MIVAEENSVDWVHRDPGLDFDDARLGELLQYWDEKRGARTMPTRTDIDPLDIVNHMSRLYLVDVQHHPFRLRYRLIGTETVDTLHRDMTGKYFDEIYPDHILVEVLRHYEFMVRSKQPLRVYGNGTFANKRIYLFEGVYLPLSEDGETINMILGEMVLKPDTFETTQTYYAARHNTQ